MSHIFVSYVAEDTSIAREIAGGLEAAGYSTWYFEHNVVPGSSYVKQISQALNNCCAFVVVASPRSIDSDQVTKEVIAAGSSLKVIGRAGAGVDNIDVKAASERGIVVLNTPGANAEGAGSWPWRCCSPFPATLRAPTTR
jgi:phosphoglycerate dehydrogenase-like enzyme